MVWNDLVEMIVAVQVMSTERLDSRETDNDARGRKWKVKRGVLTPRTMRDKFVQIRNPP